MAAVRAEAVELEPVGLNHEAVFGGHFLLEAFDFAILELHDRPATCADEMVVMTFVRDVVVLCLCAEVSGLSDPGFAKQVQCTVDGGEA